MIIGKMMKSKSILINYKKQTDKLIIESQNKIIKFKSITKLSKIINNKSMKRIKK